MGIQALGEPEWEPAGIPIGPDGSSVVESPALSTPGSSSSTAPLPTPKIIKALHIFSGPRREGDLHDQWGKWGSRQGLTVWVEDYDIAIDAKHNMLCDSLFLALCQRLINGEYSIVIAGPLCGTFSRVRHSGGGPPPVRSRDMLWGLENLSSRSRKAVQQANILIWRTIIVCDLVHQSGGVFIIEHPEDPGPPFPSIFASRSAGLRA